MIAISTSNESFSNIPKKDLPYKGFSVFVEPLTKSESLEEFIEKEEEPPLESDW